MAFARSRAARKRGLSWLAALLFGLALAAGPVVVLLGAAPPLASQQAHAAGGQAAGGGDGHDAHGIDVKKLALQFLNFGALLFILIKFGGGAINKALRTRHETLKASIEESAKLRAAAEARMREQEKRLANLETEIAAMRAAMKQEADAERARLIAGAEEKARRIGDETRFLLDQQVKQAELRFRDEVAEAAVRVAEDVLRRSVDGHDEQRLARGFVTNVAGDGPASTSVGHSGETPRPVVTAPGSLVQ